MTHTIRIFLVLWLVALFSAACSSTKSRYSMLAGAYPPKPENFEVEVFPKGAPQRPFVKISRLDVHTERTRFGPPSIDEVLPELKKQARQSGADAIIEIQERLSWVAETRIYHVIAIGVRYTDPQ